MWASPYWYIYDNNLPLYFQNTCPSSDCRFDLINILFSYCFVARIHNGCHLECPIDSTQVRSLKNPCAVVVLLSSWYCDQCVLCSRYDEDGWSTHIMQNGEWVMAVILWSWSGAKKRGKVQCYFSRFSCHGDRNNPCPFSCAEPVTGSTGREVAQGLG